MRFLILLSALTAVLLFVGCESKEKSDESASSAETQKAPEPEYITVQHILIGFSGSLPGKAVSRTKQEAQELAQEIFKRAQSGEDFDQLVREYTDDSYPGKYKMANFGLPANAEQNIFARDRMVKAFGDVGFPLAVGEIGMAGHDPQSSPYGWHIIKRVE